MPFDWHFTKVNSTPIPVLGGTSFFSKAIATAAVRRGHDVACAARGRSGSVPEVARLVALDRDEPGVLGPLARTDGERPIQHIGIRDLPSWIGLRVRPLADTVEATLADEHARGLDRPRDLGLIKDEEVALLV